MGVIALLLDGHTNSVERNLLGFSNFAKCATSNTIFPSGISRNTLYEGGVAINTPSFV